VSHVARMNASRRTCEWVILHIWTNQNKSEAPEWAMSHVWMRHIARVNESYCTYKREKCCAYLIYACDTAYSQIWHDPFVWHDSYTRHDSDVLCVSHSHVWHGLFVDVTRPICVTWLIYEIWFIYETRLRCVVRISFRRVTQLTQKCDTTHLCDMIHSYTRHDLVVLRWVATCCDVLRCAAMGCDGLRCVAHTRLCVCMSRVSHMNESCHTNGPCHMYEQAVSYVWMRYTQHIWVVSCIWITTHKWVMPHLRSRATRVNESSYSTHEWVESEIWMSHGAHVNESCHKYELGVLHVWKWCCSVMYVCVCVCVRVRVYIHTWFTSPVRPIWNDRTACVRVCIHIHTHTHAHTHMHTNTHLHTCTHVYIYTYVHICIHI